MERSSNLRIIEALKILKPAKKLAGFLFLLPSLPSAKTGISKPHRKLNRGPVVLTAILGYEIDRTVRSSVRDKERYDRLCLRAGLAATRVLTA